MKKPLILLAAVATNAFASSYADHVNEVKAQRPYEKKKIENIDLLTTDMVIHYEQAVLLGTTPDYKEQTKISHFNSFLYAADNMCEDINLASCIYELVCEDKIPHNLKTSIMPCN